MINDYIVLMNHSMWKMFVRVCDDETETYKGKPFLFHGHSFTVDKPVSDENILLDLIIDQSIQYFRIIEGDVVFIKSIHWDERENWYEVNIAFATNDRM